MSCYTELISYIDAVSQTGNYTYALLYNYSEMKLCNASDVSETDLSECMEARFFSQDAELHLLPTEARAVVIKDRDQKNMLTESYELADRYQIDGKKTVEIRKYLEADQDGQMRVVLTRLVDLR